LAATILGVAATVLAVLGALAVAAWWTDLEKRVGKKVDELFERQLLLIDDQVEKKQQEVLDLQHRLVQDSENTSRAITNLILGNQLWEHKKHDQAIDLYRKALVLRPRDPQINYALGRACMNDGLYEDAVSYLRVAIKEDAEFGQAFMQLGLAIRFQADRNYGHTHDEDQHDAAYHEAIDCLKHASELLPDSDDAFASLGGTYRRLNKYQRSLEFYKKALKVNPKSSYARGNVGLLAWHIGDIETADETFREVETIATEHIETISSDELYWDYYDRGQARLILNQKKSAIQDYRTAIVLTRAPGEFQSVIDGLKFLLEVKEKYPIDGLEDALEMVEDALTKLLNERGHLQAAQTQQPTPF
jgi:tetratricopeptide (TPR) repeat protein